MRSPSGNIWCVLEAGLECLVMDNDYPALRPQSCEGAGDWADSWFYVGETAGVRGTCKSDTPFGDGPPPSLAYGATALMAGHACQSTTTAMICWDTRSDHGFRISRRHYDLF